VRSRVLAPALPRIAPGRWVVVSSAPVLAAQGGRLEEALGRRRNVDPAPLLVPDGRPQRAGPSWQAPLRGGAPGPDPRRGRRGVRRGTVGDVAGLAAALALRGVPVVQVPTTLLAAADSALGGKTAVNLASGKNLAGTFHHPRLVCVDTRLLATLSDRDHRSGLAEVVKSALLSATFWKRLPDLAGPRGAEEPALAEAVVRSLHVKASVVSRDPTRLSGRGTS